MNPVNMLNILTKVSRFVYVGNRIVREGLKWETSYSPPLLKKKNDTVTLIGFVTFKVAQRNARKGRNLRTGQEMTIKAKKVPRFVPGKVLKDAVG